MTDDLDLSAVASDAALLDALAAGTAPDDDALAGLAALRAALDADLEHVITAAEPTPRLQIAPASGIVAVPPPTGRRSRDRAAALLAGAALALGSTGVAAATYDARPGNALYGLRTAVAGPRAEDPGVLRDRLDAVQQQLQSADPAMRERAREELDEVAALLDDLDPGLREDLDQRYASLDEQLADEPPLPEPPAGPPTRTPRRDRTPDSRPTEPIGPPSSRPADRPAPPSANPGPKQTSTQRPAPAPTAPPGRPSPRTSQGVDRSGSTTSDPAQEPGNAESRSDDDRPGDPRGSGSAEPTSESANTTD